MIAFLLKTVDDLEKGGKNFTRDDDQVDVISHSFTDTVIDDGTGNKVLSDLKIIVYERIRRGSVWEIDDKIYRVVSSRSPLSGSCSCLLKEIRNIKEKKT